MTIPVSITVRHAINASMLARAMALDARDQHPGAYCGPDDTEDGKLTHHVNGMSRTAAFRALRECLWAYGDVSWPEDIPEQARRAALVRARGWLP